MTAVALRARCSGTFAGVRDVSGYRLAEERKRRGLTQAQLAGIMRLTPGRVSQIERGEVSTPDAIVRYVEALGGRLDVGLVEHPSPSAMPTSEDAGRRRAPYAQLWSI